MEYSKILNWLFWCVSQVNSDVVFYQRSRDGSMVPVRKNTKHVGRLVLTKAIATNGRREITASYKFPEGKNTMIAEPAKIMTEVGRE